MSTRGDVKLPNGFSTRVRTVKRYTILGLQGQDLLVTCAPHKKKIVLAIDGRYPRKLWNGWFTYRLWKPRHDLEIRNIQYVPGLDPWPEWITIEIGNADIIKVGNQISEAIPLPYEPDPYLDQLQTQMELAPSARKRLLDELNAEEDYSTPLLSRRRIRTAEVPPSAPRKTTRRKRISVREMKALQEGAFPYKRLYRQMYGAQDIPTTKLPWSKRRLLLR